MSTILSEYDRGVVKRQVFAILQSPQGRDLGRWFLTERGKEAGNLGAVLAEIQTILRDCVFDLYASPAPVQSNAVKGA